ncbi:MAG TPA: peptidoglycan editing factor PgeF [Rhizomicrobium sp.]|nr:peptidoglycan editing factor PgeF [Rhizomicrobium sp.]
MGEKIFFHHAANLAAEPCLAHGFFTREGGVSSGVYATLNCGPGSRDDPAAVRENRRRAAAVLAADARLVTLAQIHSPTVHVVGTDWDFAARREGDGLATAEPGVALGILSADCAPVLFADAKAGVIGAAHAGWKGAVGGVLEATIAAMEKLGAKTARLVAAIGPAICQANYEVGQDLRDRFSGKDARFFVEAGRPGHFRFDLPGYVVERLRNAGIGMVTDLALCTYPPANGLFSYRRATHRGEADYGRELSAIILKK